MSECCEEMTNRLKVKVIIAMLFKIPLNYYNQVHRLILTNAFETFFDRLLRSKLKTSL